MKGLALARAGERLNVLCLGAHSDDIEIGCGATLLDWIDRGVRLDVHWAVLSANGPRQMEARTSAHAFLAGAHRAEIDLNGFRDGYFPAERTEIKGWFERLKTRVQPDLIFTHHHDDAHQDHRLVAELTLNTFRDHLTLAYEIPKWDGDLGRPNIYAPASERIIDAKIELLMTHFATQRSKDWFDAETFRGLARLRGMECRAPERFAEAFHGRKLVLASGRTFGASFRATHDRCPKRGAARHIGIQRRRLMRVVVTGHMGYIGTVACAPVDGGGPALARAAPNAAGRGMTDA